MRVFAALALLCASPAFGAYGFKRSFTLDHTQAGATDSPNFTVVLSGTYSTLATVSGGGGHVQNTVACGANSITCPADLVFTQDATCATTTLTWDVESYTAASGAIIVWVKVPSLSHTGDTVIWACYGDASVVAFQGGAQGSAYDASTKEVYPLGSTTINDYSASAINLTNTGVPVLTTGKIGNGVSFPAANSFTNLSAISAVNSGIGASAYTISAWFNVTSYVAISSFPNVFVSTGIAAFPGYDTGLFVTASGFVGGGFSDSSQVQHITTGTAAATGTWIHMVTTWDGTTVKSYMNAGAPSTVATSATRADGLVRLNDGGGAWLSSRFISVVIDEAKFASTARSADWITAEYNNQNNPGGFYVVSGETPLSSTSAPRLTLLGVGP